MGSEVCEIFAKTHGVHAEVCAEPFFYYGKALLEMSKIESAVLGNCLEGFDHELVEEKSTSAKWRTKKTCPRMRWRRLMNRCGMHLSRTLTSMKLLPCCTAVKRNSMRILMKKSLRKRNRMQRASLMVMTWDTWSWPGRCLS